jgi:hypothetical protein
MTEITNFMEAFPYTDFESAVTVNQYEWCPKFRRIPNGKLWEKLVFVHHKQHPNERGNRFTPFFYRDNFVKDRAQLCNEGKYADGFYLFNSYEKNKKGIICVALPNETFVAKGLEHKIYKDTSIYDWKDLEEYRSVFDDLGQSWGNTYLQYFFHNKTARLMDCNTFLRLPSDEVRIVLNFKRPIDPKRPTYTLLKDGGFILWFLPGAVMSATRFYSKSLGSAFYQISFFEKRRIATAASEFWARVGRRDMAKFYIGVIADKISQFRHLIPDEPSLYHDLMCSFFAHNGDNKNAYQDKTVQELLTKIYDGAVKDWLLGK